MSILFLFRFNNINNKVKGIKKKIGHSKSFVGLAKVGVCYESGDNGLKVNYLDHFSAYLLRSSIQK